MSLLYLPIEEPLGRPTVHRFGADFGHGSLDSRFFQPSTEAERAPQATRLVATDADADDARLHEAALRWLDDTLRAELSLTPGDDPTDVGDRYGRRLAHVAEDLVVLHRGDGEGSIRAVHVRAPSSWRPERALGASLAALHAHVPGLLARASATKLTQMMIDRGPYVRFVWGLSTSDALDHHPDRVRRPDWADAEAAYLRVERQVTVPLRDVDAALFLLRVYVHPVATVPDAAREALRRVLSGLTPELRAYKGLPADPRAIDYLISR